MKNLFHIVKKTFTWVTVTMAVSLFNGCSDFLDKQPLGKLNESVLTDDAVKAADFNKDRIIDVIDVTAIQTFIAHGQN